MSDSSTRGGRRPGAGRKPGNGAGPNPEIRERVPADLADYCKAQQATSPGFLARLIKQHKEQIMITKANIEALKEAGEAGDLKQVELCEAALAGDEAAWAKCEAAITANRYED